MSLSNRNSLEPWISDDLKYYDYQADGIRWMMDRRSFILADDMGLGKTLAILTVHAIDVKRRKTSYQGETLYGETLLVVCPSTVKFGWEEQIEQFTKFPFMSLNGPPEERLRQLEKFKTDTGPRILLVGYEQLAIHLDQLNSIGFHIAAFDEAHRMKNMRSRTSKSCMGLFATRFICATASPILNQVDELYPLLERVVPGEFGSYRNFIGRYCNFGGYQNKKIVGVKNEAELRRRMANIIIRRRKEDVLELPTLQIIRRPCGLHARQKSLYRQVSDELRIENPNGKISDVKGAMVKVLRLKQICATTATVIDEDYSDKLTYAETDARLIMASGHRVLAFTQFRSVLESYQRRMSRSDIGMHGKSGFPVFVIHGDTPHVSDKRPPDHPDKKLSRQEVVQAWSESEVPGILIAMYQVTGVGLNMTAGRYGQMLDKLFVPELQAQAAARLHRIGASQVQPVQILEYLCPSTIEDRIEKILQSKRVLFERVIEEGQFNKLLLTELLREEDEFQ